jgi:hypothetical protein
MACKIKYNKDGSVNHVVAENGERSKLYDDIRTDKNDSRGKDSLNDYFYIQTDLYKDWSTEKKIDSNNEPLLNDLKEFISFIPNKTDQQPSVSNLSKEEINDIVKGKDTFYQFDSDTSLDSIIASEKTIRDLATRLADRIGLKVRFISITKIVLK